MTRLEIGVDYTTERSQLIGKDFIEKILYKFITESGYTYEGKKDSTYYCFCDGDANKEATSYYMFISRLFPSILVKDSINKFISYDIDNNTGEIFKEDHTSYMKKQYSMV